MASTRMTGMIGVCALALAALAASPAAAAPVSANRIAAANVKVVKPLVLTWLQDLNLGTVVLGGTGAWSGATVGISRAGAFACTNANTTCSGATAPARYRLTGTNNMTATISAPPAILTNQGDPTKTLTLTLDAPASVTFGNSGNQGVEFGVGGTITLASTTADGTYSGTLNVTVDYQ